MSEIIKLFPLGSVLMPGGRMGLRIFERRYLDLVKDSIRDETEFGIVLLSRGSDVIREDDEHGVELHSVGCTAKIVDWDSLPGGLLGIVVEGHRRFEVKAFWQEDSGLQHAKVDFLPEDPIIPLDDAAEELRGLLFTLLDHPHLEGLGIQREVDDVATLANLLTQYVPVSEDARYSLLEADSPLVRLEILDEILAELKE